MDCNVWFARAELLPPPPVLLASAGTTTPADTTAVPDALLNRATAAPETCVKL